MSKVKRDDKKRGTASWILDFAGTKRKEYVVSVVTALIGVACSIVPYLIMIELIQNIIAGTATRAWCIKECIYMGMWWIARYAFHSISSCISHHATFTVLANIRLRLLDKLTKLPLGTVLEQSSGSYKNTVSVK